jgi:hypothetical protein
MTEITQYGILPPGIHEMTLEEVSRCFGNVPKSSHRLRLYEKLKEYVERLQTLQIGIALIVDGSFAMPCIETPEDIDIVLVMPENWDKALERIPDEYYNVVSSERVEDEFFGLHVFAVAENSPHYHSWIRVFSEIKGDWRVMFDIPQNVLKGLIRITL